MRQTNKNIPFRLLLFDLDGTLTDSGPGIINSIKYALAAMGLPESDAAVLRSFVGPPLAASFKRYYHLDDAGAYRAVELYREYYRQRGMFENTLYPGIEQLLEVLCKEAGELAIATSKPAVFAEKVIRHFGLDKYFSLVAGSNLDGTLVNKDEVIGDALRRLPRYRPEETVMIGDREHDIYGARAHGLASIGVTYGYGSRSELLKAKADYLAASVQELKEILLPGRMDSF